MLLLSSRKWGKFRWFVTLGGSISEESGSVGTELRDNDADESRNAFLPAFAGAELPQLQIGQSALAYVLGGTPPFTFVIEGGVVVPGPLLTGTYDLNSDGLLDQAQSYIIVATVMKFDIHHGCNEGSQCRGLLRLYRASPRSAIVTCH